jgi:hypothetical protein
MLFNYAEMLSPAQTEYFPLTNVKSPFSNVQVSVARLHASTMPK